jgi:hypothetical protein
MANVFVMCRTNQSEKEELANMGLFDLLKRREEHEPTGKCPEISTDLALKHAHLPRIVGSTTIGCLKNHSRGDCKLLVMVNTDRPGAAFCAAPCSDKKTEP